MESNKILKLVGNNKDSNETKSKSEHDGYVIVTYSDDSEVTIQSDSFGDHPNLKGFILFWSDYSDTPKLLVNERFIKSIKILEESECLSMI
ncbi:hypothetical protein [Caudoviricetes sp.]|nr:hypothetical protein [Caudoviricetes sp.]